ncbi:MAG: hypothetical protein AB1643_01700 [Patescibacteria group bacterium]
MKFALFFLICFSVFNLNSVLAAGAPSLFNYYAKDVSQTSAILSAGVNPNGLNTDVWFQWGDIDLGLSNETAHQNMGDGTVYIDFISGLSGLSTETTYLFRPVAQNSAGTTYGSTFSFKTTSFVSNLNPPIVYTYVIDDLLPTSVTLKGSVNPNSSDTSAWFEWGLSASGLTNETSHQAIGSGFVFVDFLSGLTNLSSGNVYYYRAVAQNSIGITRGSTLSFTTGAVGLPGNKSPSVIAGYATEINQTSVALRASVSPNGLQTNAWFQWGDIDLGLSNETAHQNMGDGTVYIDFISGLSGLSTETTYLFRPVAQNSAGTTYGSTFSFTTGPPAGGTTSGTAGGGTSSITGSCAPIVTTGSAAFVTKDSATLRGVVNPRNRSATAWFEYGESYSLTFRTTSQDIGSGNVDTDILRYLGNLKPNTTYYFRLVSENICGRSFGSTLIFTTGKALGSSPEIVVYPPDQVSQTSALLKGSINPKNSSTVAWFEWGTDPTLNLYTITNSFSVGSGDSFIPVSFQLVSLSPNINYYYRLVAKNDFGITRGVIFNFKTLPVIVVQPLVSEKATTPASFSSFSVWKEMKNLSFPNGSNLINSASIGDTIEYLLNIKNETGDELKNITVKDSLSQNFDFLDSNPPTSVSSDSNLFWKIASLSSKKTATISLRVKTKPVEKNITIANSFSATAATITKKSNETITILNLDLISLDINADKNEVKYNEEINYTVRYRNIGIADVDNVILKIILPEGLSVKSANPPDYSSERNILFFDLGKIKEKDSGSIDVKVKVEDSAEENGKLITTAILGFTDIFGNPQPDISVSNTIIIEPGFTAVATVGFSLAKFGSWIYIVIILLLGFLGLIIYIRYRVSKILKEKDKK